MKVLTECNKCEKQKECKHQVNFKVYCSMYKDNCEDMSLSCNFYKKDER